MTLGKYFLQEMLYVWNGLLMLKENSKASHNHLNLISQALGELEERKKTAGGVDLCELFYRERPDRIRIRLKFRLASLYILDKFSCRYRKSQ